MTPDNNSNQAAEYRPSKKMLQFSQRLAQMIVVFSMWIVFYTITINAILLFLEKPGMTDETIAMITTFGGIVATVAPVVYGVLTGWRDYSKNKYGVTLAEMKYANPAEPTGDAGEIETEEN